MNKSDNKGNFKKTLINLIIDKIVLINHYIAVTNMGTTEKHLAIKMILTHITTIKMEDLQFLAK